MKNYTVFNIRDEISLILAILRDHIEPLMNEIGIEKFQNKIKITDCVEFPSIYDNTEYYINKLYHFLNIVVIVPDDDLNACLDNFQNIIMEDYLRGFKYIWAHVKSRATKDDKEKIHDAIEKIKTRSMNYVTSQKFKEEFEKILKGED